MIIAIDFDGTLVEHAYPAIGKEIPFAIDTLIKLQQEEHHQLILWTVREGKLLEQAVHYCQERGLEFYAINRNYPEESYESMNSRKISADLFVDDRNLGGIPDWGLIYRLIKSMDGTDHPIRGYEEVFHNAYSQRKAMKKENIFLKIGNWLDGRK